jgi:hypothetical protein
MNNLEKDKRKCGLCGKKRKLIKTECCNQWICNDYDNYVAFSYARNSCSRNHNLFTICGYHHNEGHSGDWSKCNKCRKKIETEMYVYYGTNKYNFWKLEEVPSFKPKHCATCNKIIIMSEGGFSQKGEEYWCYNCTNKQMRKISRRTRALSGRNTTR